MAYNSFRREGRPPIRYRTPSPPLRDVSPLSPHTFEGASPGVRHGATTHGFSVKSTTTSKRKPQRDARAEHQPILQRAAMDNFAVLALAAHSDPSVRYVKDGSQHSHQTWTEEQNNDAKASKRARSEKLASSEMVRNNSRPVTSYVQPTEDRRLEAELLLNFSREACFAVPRPSTSHRDIHIPPVNGSVTDRRTQRPSTSTLTPYRTAHDYGNKYSRNTAAAVAATSDVREESSIKTSTEEHPYQSDSGIVGEDSSTAQNLEVSVSDSLQPSSGEAPSNGPATETSKGQYHDGTESSLNQQSCGGPEAHLRGLDKYTDNGCSKESEDKGDVGPDDACIIAPAEGSHSGGRDTLGTKRFPNGIEEAARGGVSIIVDRLDFVPNPPEEHTQSIPSSDGSRVETLSTKHRQPAAPSVCAACNFSRNSLTLETENDATSWISCDGCKSWFHFACAGFKNEREVRGVDKYRCRKCKPTHGPTTYVRKSARAHSAIDYAGLNEGVLKTSDESPEHHYIKPIKDGIIKFHPENFARMRPELVTAEYFQKGDGMKEPIVIPASLNPRPRPIPDLASSSDANQDGDSVAIPMGEDDLHDASVLEQWLSKEFEYQTVPDHGQDALDMVVPQDLTVRKVSELYGPEEKVEVIDVKSQNGEDRKWNMSRWVEYYESQGNKVVRNVISLEVSQSKLGRLIRRPKVVRDLDLQDSVWPVELQAKGDYPKVQFYCLMSVADCFTDFHIDFGGSSVFYHILKGKKTFFFIPPHEKHLKKYEEWCMSPAQNWTFLGDQTKECYRVDLSEGDTMLIPAGWIHAVWTPEDSLVIGGNFLTKMHYEMQIRVAQIEKVTGVARKFRYPHFQKVLWYAAMKYLEDDPLPDSVTDSLLAGRIFPREKPTYLDFDGWGEASNLGPENYHARYYSKAELDGLPELGRYLHRTALIAIGNITEGISVETRNAVKRSIPKGNGEPLDVVKRFAVWYTWKRGNENVPHWAYPEHIPEGGAPELAEKKLSAAALRRLDREAALQAWRIAPDRQSARRRSQPLNLYGELTSDTATTDEGARPSRSSSGPRMESHSYLKKKHNIIDPREQSTGSTFTTSKRRRVVVGTTTPVNKGPACELCRKRRRACKHREIINPSPRPNTQDVAEGLIIVNSSPSVMGTSPIISNSAKSLLVHHSSSIRLPSTGAANLPAPEVLQSEYRGHRSLSPHDLEQSSLQMLQVDSMRPDLGTEAENSTVNAMSLVAVPGFNSTTMSAFSAPMDASALDLMRTPGRTKACKDCRKSKRRCVHDENGNEDPVKVAEAAVPRSSGLSQKRKTSSDNIDSSPIRKAKKTVTVPTTEEQVQPQPLTQVPEREIPIEKVVEVPELLKSHAELAQQALHHTTHSPNPQPKSPPGDAHAPVDITEPLAPPSESFFEVDEVHLIATSPLSELKWDPEFETPMLSPAPDFPQPSASALVSPPASHSDAERTPPAPSKTQNITPYATSSSSRHSSHAAKNGQRYTPESGPARRASSSSVNIERPKLRSSGSPAASAAVRGTPSVGGSGQKRKSRMSSEIEADEESMRLIRELQAQDLGLRRRGRG